MGAILYEETRIVIEVTVKIQKYMKLNTMEKKMKENVSSRNDAVLILFNEL